MLKILRKKARITHGERKACSPETPRGAIFRVGSGEKSRSARRYIIYLAAVSTRADYLAAPVYFSL